MNLGTNGVLLTVTLMLAARGESPARIGLLSGALLVGGIAVLALLVAAIPFTSSLLQIAVLYAGMGFGLPAINAAVGGYMMHITPVEMQGRIGSLMGLMTMGLMPIAPAIAGWGLESVGAVTTLAAFAGICVVSAIIAVASRALRSVPRSSRWEEHARDAGLVASGVDGA